MSRPYYITAEGAAPNPVRAVGWAQRNGGVWHFTEDLRPAPHREVHTVCGQRFIAYAARSPLTEMHRYNPLRSIKPLRPQIGWPTPADDDETDWPPAPQLAGGFCRRCQRDTPLPAPAVTIDVELTRIPVMWRDASNYKAHDCYLLRGRFSDADLAELRGCLADNGRGERVYYLPAQIDREHLRDSTGWSNYDDDSPWHELNPDEITTELQAMRPRNAGELDSTDTFLALMREAHRVGWNTEAAAAAM